MWKISYLSQTVFVRSTNEALKRTNAPIHAHIHTHTCIHIYLREQSGIHIRGERDSCFWIKSWSFFITPTIRLPGPPYEQQFWQLILDVVSTIYHQIIQLKICIWDSQSFCDQELWDRPLATSVKLWTTTANNSQRQVTRSTYHGTVTYKVNVMNVNEKVVNIAITLITYVQSI